MNWDLSLSWTRTSRTQTQIQEHKPRNSKKKKKSLSLRKFLLCLEHRRGGIGFIGFQTMEQLSHREVWLPSSLRSSGFKIWASLSIAFSDPLDWIGLGFGSSGFRSASVIYGSGSGSGFGYGASCSGCDSGWGNGSDGLGCGSSSNSEFEFGLGTTPFCNFGFFWGCSGN